MQYFCLFILCSVLTLFCTVDDGYGAESVTAKANLQKLIKSNSCRGCDLSGVNLNRVDLSDADLEGANLSKAKMYLTNLSRVNLRNADLRGVVFGGADLGDADLRGADLRGTALDGAYLGGTLLDGKFVITKPYEKDGISEIEREVYIEDPSKPKQKPKTKEIVVAPRRVFEEPPPALPEKKAVSEVVIKENYPQAPEVKKPTLLKPIEIEAELLTEKNEGDSGPVEIDLNRGRGAENQNLAAEKKKRDNAARLFDTKKCYDCDLSGVDFSNKNLAGADLEKSDLTNANLEKTDLRGANLKGALLIQANLRGADLKKADFYRADLTGADLTGANTESTLFDSADLSGSRGLSSDVISKKK